MKWFWIVILFIFTAANAPADNTVTKKPDPRLDKKVTLEVSHTKLEDVAKQLTEQTGVVIKAGSGERDWRVRERRITIQAKDVRLGDLMEQISKLLNYYLSRGGKEGEWTYLYWQDMKARILEEDLLAAEREAAAQRIVKVRQGALDIAEKALKMTPEDALKERDKDPMLAYMGGTQTGRGFAQLLAALNRDFAIERDLMLRGRMVNMMLSDFSPALQQAAADIAAGGFFAETKKQLGGDSFKELVPCQMTFMPAAWDEGQMGALGLGGFMIIYGLPPGVEWGKDSSFGSGIPMGLLPLCDPNSLMGKLFGKVFFAFEEGASFTEAVQKVQSDNDFADSLIDTMARESKTEKDPPTDPELTREVELGKIPGIGQSGNSGNSIENLSKTVVEIAKAIGEPVLMESFIKLMPIGGFVKPGKQPFYRILTGLEKAGYTWELSGGMLRIRPEDWALRRSYEISENNWLAYYKNLLEKNGEFTLDELAAMTFDLTDDQINNTLSVDPDLQCAIIGQDNMSGHRNLMRVYATLSAQQKAMLYSESGLAFADLTAAQWDRVNEFITSRLNSGIYIIDGGIRLNLKPQAKEKKPGADSTAAFEVTVYAANEEKPRTFNAVITIIGKDRIAKMKKIERDAKEAAEKRNKQNEQANPAPTSPPKQ